MIYINLSDSSIEIIQTKRRFLRGEKIMASSRRELPEGLIINGVVIEPDRFITYLKDIFTSAYPHSIKDKTVTMAVSDSQVVHGRFLLESANKDYDATKLIIEEARKILPGEATEFEHFYKGIKISQSSQEVLYTAASRNTIVHFAKILEPLGIKLTFLSSKSFALFELFKSFMAKDECFLYCDIDKKTEYYCFDQYGPIVYLDKKFNAKTFISDTKNILDKLKEEKEIKLTKIILGGIGSIETHASELYDNSGVTTIKMGEVIDKVIHKYRLNFDTGGTSYMLFADVLGLILLSKNKTAPNFARDLNIFQSTHSESVDEHMTHFQEKDKVEIEKKESTEDTERKTVREESFVITDRIVEKNKFSIITLITNKIFIMVIVGFIVFGIALGLISIIGNNKSNLIPFFAGPTTTPTPTLVPTMTPTPTIDPNLKRSNIKISVQNGSGKTGYAKEVALYLENKGYKNVAKGNADKDDYENTLIRIKNTTKNYLPLLLQDITEKFSTPKVESLGDDDKYDVIIILGKN